ncbi:MAG: high-potential iron-sulfur protein [Caulobacteraceae bacterium]|nr:high-potential iron-sulfur protein [Caulobacteraceae bacterium]
MKTNTLLARNLPRRAVLSGAILVLTGLGAGSVAAQAKKIPQKAASYRDKPLGKARCDNCSLWQSPASCKVVEGQISPSGWCSLYSPKS